LNLFTQTVAIDRMKGRILVALGTDSLLTGSSCMFEEMQTACRTGMVTPQGVFAMVTTDAAKVLRLPDGSVNLGIGAPADLIVLPDRGRDPAETLLNIVPRDLYMVVIAGRMHLADAETGIKPNILLQGKPKYIFGNPSVLKKRIAKHFQQRSEFLNSPLWQMMQPL
jgi:cytosine/adenosine deaminase-related metal-dependent hydrolase